MILANEALVWAGVHLGDPDPTIARAFADAYRSASGEGEEFHATDLAELVALRLGWFEFNVHRALGERIRGDSDRSSARTLYGEISSNSRGSAARSTRGSPSSRTRRVRRPSSAAVNLSRHSGVVTYASSLSVHTRRAHNPADDHPSTHVRASCTSPHWRSAARCCSAAQPHRRASQHKRQTMRSSSAFSHRSRPEERVGQLVMVNFVGDDVSASSDIAALIRDYHVGAVLVTASNGNIVNRGDTAGQLATLTNGLQQRSFEASARTDSTNGQYFLPLYVATDNEGDLFPLTNVTNGFTAVPNNMTIGATWSKQDAQATGAIVGKELSAAGINMLLGPVVDVLGNPRSGGNGDIGIRSFGGDPAWVGALGRAYVRGVHEGQRRPHAHRDQALPRPRQQRPRHRQRSADRQQVTGAAPRLGSRAVRRGGSRRRRGPGWHHRRDDGVAHPLPQLRARRRRHRSLAPSPSMPRRSRR